MATIFVNGVELHHEIVGAGPPMVLVHGSWSDHTAWQPAAALLADDFQVVSYDRRGHSRSERPSGSRARRQDEDDLAALIEAQDLGPAHLVASSFGGLVALGLAARRPDLVRSVAAHEPPALPVFASGPQDKLVGAVMAIVTRVLDDIDAGEAESAARRFMEVALGPGSWDLLPDGMRAAVIANAPAFAAEQRDPDCLAVDFAGLDRLGSRVLLSAGDASPLWLRAIAEELRERLPAAQAATIAGAGHVPHVTHPSELSELVKSFVAMQTVAVPS